MTADEIPLRPRRPIVVVDTTAIFEDPQLRREDWQRLLEHVGDEVVRLVVPEVVIAEANRQNADRATKANNEAIKKAAEGLRELRKFVEGIPDLDVTRVRSDLSLSIERYEAELRERLESHSAEIAPLPGIGHAELLRWDLDRRKPFKADGKGYRDALIWATVVEVTRQLDESEHLVLITGNLSDFAEGDQLSPDLATDVGGAGAPRITLSRSPRDALKALDKEIQAFAEELDSPGGWVPSGAVERLVEADVESVAERLLGTEVEDSASLEGLNLPTELASPTWYSINLKYTTAHWNLVAGFTDGSMLGELTVEAYVTLDGYVSKADYFAAEDGDFDVLDADWNEHSVWVSVDRSVTLTFSLVIDPDVRSVDDVEFRGASSSTTYFLHLPPKGEK